MLHYWRHRQQFEQTDILHCSHELRSDDKCHKIACARGNLGGKSDEDLSSIAPVATHVSIDNAGHTHHLGQQEKPPRSKGTSSDMARNTAQIAARSNAYQHDAHPNSQDRQCGAQCVTITTRTRRHTMNESRQQARATQGTDYNQCKQRLHKRGFGHVINTMTHKPPHTLLAQQIGAHTTIRKRKRIDISHPREKHQKSQKQEIKTIHQPQAFWGQ